MFLVFLVLGSATLSGKVTASADAPLYVFIEHAETPAAPKTTAVSMAQKDTDFSPKTLIAFVGQKIDFPNQDAFYHNVFSTTAGNAFDLGLYRGGLSKSATMKAAGEVDVYCNIHPKMAAKILVLQNDFYAAVAADGTYKIAAVPDGHYSLVAWSAAHEPQKKEIDVKGGKAVTTDFSLKPRAHDDHTNKFGEEYGRYK